MLNISKTTTLPNDSICKVYTKPECGKDHYVVMGKLRYGKCNRKTIDRDSLQETRKYNIDGEALQETREYNYYI